jgi:hypothetical protein
MYILLILLGCNILYLLNDRIDTAVNFVSKYNNTNVDWFLSGGIKNPSEDTITEAEKMANKISDLERIQSKGNIWNYIYDIKATNTAENLIMAKNYTLHSNKKYDEIYIITSDFHHNRANRMAQQILDIHFRWLLAGAKCEDCDYWEKIHIRNVDADIRKALEKYQM